MAIRSHELALGEFYHIYNRGTDKRVIFHDAPDYRRFLDLLFVCNTAKPINVRDVRGNHESVYDFDRGEALVSIGAYCLMPNHFHILITPRVEGGITKFMGKVSTSYSMYFNKRHDRSGALFQGRFKSQHATNDEYLKYLYAYIHLNPRKLYSEVEDGELFRALKNYPYSSLQSYLLSTPEKAILDPACFPDYFSSPKDHMEELQDWLSLGPA